jgi:hypothetical protein
MDGVPAEKLPAAALSEHRQLLRWLVQAGRHSSSHPRACSFHHAGDDTEQSKKGD